MKIKEKLKNLPHFIKADKIKVPFLIIVFLLLMIVVLTFIADWKIGIGIMLLCVGIFGFISYSSEYLIDETNQYISDLSYRIKKGEQEALIKMPIGILLYNKQEEIQWMNPYLIKYFGKKDTLGRKLNVVDEELYQLFKGSQDYVMRRVKWGDHYFDMIIQEDIGVIYLMDITEYAKIEERYKDEKFVFGNIIVDNYDEAVQSMNDR